jgi:ABC-type Zn2+ transport system substrate-binding protein/surface adhesin
VVVQVVLWMRETMRPAFFLSELSLRPKAVNVYTDYLKDTKRWDQLEKFLIDIRQAELARWGEKRGNNYNTHTHTHTHTHTRTHAHAHTPAHAHTHAHTFSGKIRVLSVDVNLLRVVF